MVFGLLRSWEFAVLIGLGPVQSRSFSVSRLDFQTLENTTLRLTFHAREGSCIDAGAMVGRVVSVPHFERDGLLPASQWVMSSSFRERRQVGGKCTPPSRVSSEGGDGGQAPCTVAMVGCLVTRPPMLDSMDVRCDEEGFTPPGHIKNGV